MNFIESPEFICLLKINEELSACLQQGAKDRNLISIERFNFLLDKINKIFSNWNFIKNKCQP